MASSADAQDRDRLRETQQLADTTYRNIEEYMDDMNNMVSAAKVYQTSLKSMATASESFYGIMESVGAKSSNLPGAVRKLGNCMLDMVASYRHMSENFEDWIESLNTDFIVPMEIKLKERKNIVREHKAYKKESRKRALRMNKSSKVLKRAMKKKSTSRSQSERQLQLKHALIENTEMMRVTCVDSLRRALIEERKLYCFSVEHFCSVLQNQISYNATSHNMLSTRVNTWSNLCSSPEELPTESAVLLTDPRAARAFPPAGEDLDDVSRAPGSMLAEALRIGPIAAKQQKRASCRVKALYSHQNSTGAQLEFNPGDFIDAIDEPQDGWQYGENTRTGGTGWFPVQYVHKIWPSPSPNANRRVDNLLSPHPNSLQLGNSSTEREYLHHQLQQGSGSRRSSLTSNPPSFR